MKKVLIFGSNGFIGSNLSKWLKANTILEVIESSRDPSNFYFCNLLNKQNICSLLELVRPDVIINASGISDHFLSENNRNLTLDSNVISVHSILECILKITPNTRFVNLGSVKELDVENDFYGVSKQMARNIIEYFQRQKKIWATQLYLSNITGPNQSDKYVCPKIINKIKEVRKNPDSSPVLLGNIESYIRLLYIEEACNLIWTAATSDNPIDYIIEGEKIRIKDFIKPELSLDYI